jgi:hypothetical protein
MENEKHRVKISVIIPVFNVEKYLRRRLYLAAFGDADYAV